MAKYQPPTDDAGAVVAVVTRPEGKRTRILPRTPEMENFLAAGYNGMTVKRAETIIAERKANPASWPLERAELAEAFLAAYNAGPNEYRAIDTSPGFNQPGSDDYEEN